MTIYILVVISPYCKITFESPYLSVVDNAENQYKENNQNITIRDQKEIA